MRVNLVTPATRETRVKLPDRYSLESHLFQQVSGQKKPDKTPKIFDLEELLFFQVAGKHRYE